MEEFYLKTPFIKLDQLLKATAIAQSGGEAKILIAEGYILVNDEVETRRGRKIKSGDKVCHREDNSINIVVK